MPEESSEITEALLKGYYLLSVSPLAAFRSLRVGLNLLGALQTEGFYSQWRRNLFMGEILVKLWSSLDLCMRGGVNCYICIRLNRRKDSGSPDAGLWVMHRSCIRAVSQGDFIFPGQFTLTPTSNTGEQIQSRAACGHLVLEKAHVSAVLLRMWCKVCCSKLWVG